MSINPDWQSHIGKFTLTVAEALDLKQKVKNNDPAIRPAKDW